MTTKRSSDSLTDEYIQDEINRLVEKGSNSIYIADKNIDVILNRF